VLRVVNLIRYVVMVVALVALSSAYAVDSLAPSTAWPIVPPRGLVSVEHSAAAAKFSKYAENSALIFLDAYLTPSDISKIEKRESPEKRHYAVVLQPSDPTLRYATPEVFAAIVQDMRKNFFGREQLSHANNYMKDKGEDSKLVSTNGNRILVDDVNCFAVVTLGKYEIDGSSKFPPMNLGVAYVRIKGQFFVIKLFAKGTAPEETAWLTNDVPVWLRSLTAKN
jgi:hypothetical protein